MRFCMQLLHACGLSSMSVMGPFFWKSWTKVRVSTYTIKFVYSNHFNEELGLGRERGWGWRSSDKLPERMVARLSL